MRKEKGNSYVKDSETSILKQIDSLVQSFARGEITSYQARVFFNDSIRDSTDVKQQDHFTKVLEESLIGQIMKGVANPSDEDIEAVMMKHIESILSGTETETVGRLQFNQVIYKLPKSAQEKWNGVFNSILSDIKTEKLKHGEERLKATRRFFMAIEAFAVLILIPGLIYYVIRQLETPWWLGLLFVPLSFAFIIFVVKYIEYCEWKDRINNE